ncbi:hypothetical protein [Streptomyces lydicus]|uniref:hypothetical protein n=1 Tax=Streptomyces lydicus TaxID=47763 RepID=UPI0010101069|nr:hypothetical protein [Streptomyces lydicus]MCZ1006348.1 hypothetical protein [Streptomyces lydicus]
MAHQPYPNRDRALRHVRRAHTIAQHGHVPQQAALGIAAEGLWAFAESLRRAQPAGAQIAAALARKKRPA